MELPKLVVYPRDREFRHYSRSQREEVVMRFLFDGLSMRRLDRDVLGLNMDETNGYQSWAILKHYGLGTDFKGLFKGKTSEEALILLSDDPQFDTICDIISGTAEEIGSEPEKRALGYSVMRLVKTRVNQDKFREAVLEAYGGSCCITGITEPRLLRASHIKPWSVSNEIEKTDVRNGLCLNSLHDAAFDTGLIAIDPSNYQIRLSSKIEDSMNPDVYDEYFRKYDGIQISLPDENNLPNTDYLEYHLRNIFEKNRKVIHLGSIVLDDFC